MSEPFSFQFDYHSCRAAFLSAAEKRGVVKSHPHPLTSASGSGTALAVDTVYVGPEDAANLCIVLSGTHGVEGAAGSNAQTHWLTVSGEQDLPEDTALLFVHAVNPWGFARNARTNPNHVDINRNFLPNFDQLTPAHPVAQQVVDILAPSCEDVPSKEMIMAEVNAFAKEHSIDLFVQLAAGGQYHFPRSLQFGGQAPQWEHKTLVSIVQEAAQGRDCIALIDYHTGLGGYGQDFFMSFDPSESAGFKRACAWFGADKFERAVNEHDGKPDQVQSDYEGLLVTGLCRLLKDVPHVTALVIEFGTYPMFELLPLLVQENWLWTRSGIPADVQARVRAEYRAGFVVDAPDWTEAVCTLSRDHIDTILNGIGR